MIGLTRWSSESGVGLPRDGCHIMRPAFQLPKYGL